MNALRNIDIFSTKNCLQDKVPLVDLDLSEGEIEMEDNEDNTQPVHLQATTVTALPLPKKESFTFKGTFNTGHTTRKTGTIHSRLANKKAKYHLKRLHQLGYSSFEDTGVKYWEPISQGKNGAHTMPGSRESVRQCMNGWKKQSPRWVARHKSCPAARKQGKHPTSSQWWSSQKFHPKQAVPHKDQHQLEKDPHTHPCRHRQAKTTQTSVPGRAPERGPGTRAEDA